MARSTTPSFVVVLCLLALAASLLPAGPAHANAPASPSQQATPTVTVSGTVRDPVLGWPLYARVTVNTGAGPLTTYTNPTTGFYSVALPPNNSYAFRVEAISAGYRAETRTVAVGDVDQTELFTLEPDVESCVAPGYLKTSTTPLLAEEFSGGALPASWSNIDNIAAHGASPQHWRFDDPGGRGNLTGGSGGFAVMDSDFYGSSAIQDAELRTPTIIPGAAQVVLLEFDSDFRRLGDEKADVDVSIDGGVTWSNVWRRTNANSRTTHERVNFSAAAGGQPVMVRFHYYDADWDWWWQIDNVTITAFDCEPQPGGLLVGNIYDAATGKALNGATIVSVEAPAVSTTSFATPDDPALDDGFYIIAVPAGERAFTASQPRYASITDSVTVAVGQANRHDFQLPSGQLSGDPQAVTVTVAEGRTAEYTLTLRNTGGADLTYSLEELHGLFPTSPDNHTVPAFVDLPALPTAVSRAAGAVVDGSFYVIGGESNGDVAGQVQRYDSSTGSWDATLPLMPTPTSNSCAGVIGTDIYIAGGNLNGSEITNLLQRFHTSTGVWETIDSDPLPVRHFGLICGVYQGKLYVFGGIPEIEYSSDTYVYDPSAPAGTRWSSLAPMPIPAAFGGAVVIGERIYLAGMRNNTADLATVLVYDVAGDSWSALPNLQVARGGAGVWAFGTTLYVGGGGWTTYQNSVESYDTAQGASGAWSYATPLNHGRRTFAVANDTENQQLYVAAGWAGNYLSSAETIHLVTDVPWLSEAPTSGSIAAGAAQAVTLSFDASALASGTYHAQLKALTDAPQALRIPVTMIVGRFGLQLAAPVTAQTDDPGAVVRYNLTLTNTGNLTDSFSLSLAGNSWPTTLSATSVGPLAPGEAATVAIEVAIPAGAMAGATDHVVVTATSLSDDRQEGTAHLTTAGAVRGLALVAPVTAQTDEPGAVVRYNLILTNTGDLTDSFSLTLAGNSWPTTLSATSVGPLAPGEAATAAIEVTIPAGAMAGATDSAVVTATSLSDDRQEGTASLTTAAGAVRGFAFVAPVTAQTDEPGVVVRYNLILTNTGNLTDSFSLTLAGNSWPTTLSATSLGPLAPGETATAAIEVTIPTGAMAGATDHVVVTATSLSDATRVGNMTLTTSASPQEEEEQRYSLFLPQLRR